MRCKNCKYVSFDYQENYELCAIFGYGDEEISENRKGEEGCKYTNNQLKKMYKEQMEIIQNDGKV